MISKSQSGKKLDFKFGNGNPTTTIKVIHIPVDILGEPKRLKFYVLPGNVPCLLGMQALMKLGVVINLSLPAIKLKGKKLNARETNAGHLIWRLEICSPAYNSQAVYKIQPEQNEEEWSTMKINNLHKRLGHASTEKLIQLLDNSRKKVSKTTRRKVITVVDQCGECHNNKKQENRNKRNAYRSRDFNEVMAIDLTEWYDTENKKKHIICHMIDEFKRLSAATFIPLKNPKSIIEAIMSEWMGHYGEFNGEQYKEILGVLGIRVSTTAAYSPFSNGIVERHNSIIKSMMIERECHIQRHKLSSDPETSSIRKEHSAKSPWIFVFPIGIW